ncbi:MAG: hypothetical protein P4L84_33400 [Isosphaeraceae bacterium]|nr:hypothetical protein [Isosphaeraceae bacterium]
MLLITPWRAVPLAFFRTHCHVILGLLVLAALDVSRASSHASSGVAGVIAGAAVLAFLASVSWGLGLPRVGVPLTAGMVVATGAVLVAASRAASGELWALNGAGRVASAFLMGSTLTAMLLGHHYLTAPAMSIDPLRRFVRCMAWALAIRAGVAALGFWAWRSGAFAPSAVVPVSTFFLTVRWGVGFLGPALATVLTWKTVEIRSTQSATGILYIAMTLVLFGELTALVLSQGSGVIF